MDRKRHARIVCTIGPASDSRDVMRRMIAAGMDVARLNFSHGTHESHAKAYRMLREVAAGAGRPLAVLQDLSGIKIRTGAFPGGSITLRRGQTVRIRSGKGMGDGQSIYISCPGIERDAKIGDTLRMDDGVLGLVVTAKRNGYIEACVTEGGVLKDHKGVNLPGMRITARSFTPKDRADLDLGLRLGVDYVAVSFVREAGDIRKVRRYIESRGADARIIAKIEKPEALHNIEAILSASDGIMIARGDLGVEMPAEDVPLIQRRLIDLSNRRGKTVITATQMLESMTMHSTPTRAEVTDVATAIIEGTDAVMLSAETSTGRYPLKAVQMMDRVIKRTEGGIKVHPTYLSRGSHTEAVAFAAAEAAEAIEAAAIVAFTETGSTARLLSKYRPIVQIIAFTPHDRVRNRLALYWGVSPRIVRPLKTTDDIFVELQRTLRTEKFARRGDDIVITASVPVGGKGNTNLMKLHRL